MTFSNRAHLLAGTSQRSKYWFERYAEPRHCDDYIDDPTSPPSLIAFLNFARSPAHGMNEPRPHPELYATYEGKPVRVVMASRFGDIGFTEDLKQEHGYSKRVAVSDLSNFSASRRAIQRLFNS